MGNVGHSSSLAPLNASFYSDTSYKLKDKPELKENNTSFSEQKSIYKKAPEKVASSTSSINFVDDKNTKSQFAKAKDENGKDLLDNSGKPIYIKIDENNQPILDKEGNYQLFNSDLNSISNMPSEEYAAANDENGIPILDNKGKPVYIRLDEEGKPMQDTKGNYLTFDSDLNPINLSSVSNLDNKSGVMPLLDDKGNRVLDNKGKPLSVKVNNDGSLYTNENRKSIIIDIEGKEKEVESLEARKLIPAKYKDGKPMLDEKGKQYQQVVYEKDLVPIKNKKGENIYADPNGNILGGEKPYWQSRLFDINKLGAKTLIEPILKGGSFLSIPHKIATYVVKKEVASVLTQSLKATSDKIATQSIKNLGKTTDKVLTSTLSKLLARESGEIVLPSVIKAVSKETNKNIAKTITHLSEKGLEEGLKNSTKILEVSGKIGQGIKTITMGEARAVFGSKLNPLAHIKGYSSAIKESAEGIQKIVIKEISEKGFTDGTKSIIKGTMKGASEKALEKILKEGSEKAVKQVVINITKEASSKLSTEVLEKVSTEAVQIYAKSGSESAAKFILSKTGGATTKILEKDLAKQISKSVTEATVKVSEKGTVKFATRVSSIAPIVSTAIGIGITAWDTVDAIKKTKDPRVTKLSAGLAWATVGLDIVSTATTATGVGAPIGWVATGLGIGTSVLSDVYKYKK